MVKKSTDIFKNKQMKTIPYAV